MPAAIIPMGLALVYFGHTFAVWLRVRKKGEPGRWSATDHRK